MTSTVIEVTNTVISSEASSDYITNSVFDTLYYNSDIITTFLSVPLKEHVLVKQSNDFILTAS
jgi:hypothetical protein